MEKRAISILIPYLDDGDIRVFLQRRSKTAKRLPNFFGFFGGGIENDESPEQALRREIQEELSVDTAEAGFFCRYEFYGSVKNVYVMRVENDFENEITLGEGQYGKYFTESEAAREEKLIDEDKLVLKNFFGNIKHGNPFAY